MGLKSLWTAEISPDLAKNLFWRVGMKVRKLFEKIDNLKIFETKIDKLIV